jgi:hypothetical protein
MDDSDEKFVLRGAKKIPFYFVFQKLNAGFVLYTGTQAGSRRGGLIRIGRDDTKSVWNKIERAEEKNIRNNIS